MAAAYPIRPVRRDEFAAFRHADEHAFNGPGPDPGRMELSTRLFEPERSLAALDPAAPGYVEGAPARDGDIVGTAGAYTFQMTVPGGVLPVAGVTAVSVLPTHRRRGIARSLMTRQLTEIAQAGTEPLAALWAAEASLYGRYGYGQAASTATFRFARGEGAITTPPDPALRLRLAPPKQALAEMTAVYDAVRPGQPGLFARGDLWWERRTADFEAERGGSGPVRCLIAEDAGGPRGYAIYTTWGGWGDTDNLPQSKLVVWELVADGPAASTALWRDLLSRDLVSEVTAVNRPADDPLLYQLADLRRARPTITDGLWVRVTDLPRALAARAYSCPVDVVIEVADGLLPANAGRWRLRAPGPDGAGARCERTGDPADVALGIREVGAAYLGGTRLGALARAGLVTELRPGTLAPLSAAMGWDPSPWCPVVF